MVEKLVLWGLGLGLLLLIIAEVFLRVNYGLGHPPIYVADARTGYRLAPNQRLRRRGNRIEINQYSMRGPAIQPTRPAQTLRVLLLGDSIVNGGWWTDQSELLSVKLEQAVATDLSQADPNLGLAQVEVLNASANSWGPRNELGYVLRFGTFEAQVVVLLLNTDDLFAVAPNSYELGRHPGYPTRRPPLALWELVNRRRAHAPSPDLQALYDQPGDRVGANLEAIRQLHQTVRDSGGQLLLAMTPLKRELDPAGPKDYELVARQRLTDFAAAASIPYLDFLPVFQQSQADLLYIDHIHLSAAGNDQVGQALAQWVLQHGFPPLSLDPADPEDEPMVDLW